MKGKSAGAPLMRGATSVGLKGLRARGAMPRFVKPAPPSTPGFGWKGQRALRSLVQVRVWPVGQALLQQAALHCGGPCPGLPCAVLASNRRMSCRTCSSCSTH